MKFRYLLALVGLGGVFPGMALAWTPLISSTFFDGVQTDILTAVAGILGLTLIIFGLSMLMRTTGR